MSTTRSARPLPRLPETAWRRIDGALGVLYAIPAVMVLVNEAAGTPGTIAALIAAIGCSVTLVLRRSRPLLLLTIQLSVAVAVQVLEPRGIGVTLLPIALVLYTLASQVSRVRIAVAALAASVT